MFDPQQPSRGYALIWPRELLEAELRAITTSLEDRDQRPALQSLFDEALRGPDPQEDLEKIPDGPNPRGFDPWASPPHPSDEEDPENYCRQFGQLVLAHVQDFPVHTPRRYYLQRHQPPEPQPSTIATDLLTLQREWTRLTEDLVGRGYLDRLAGDQCEDGKTNEQPERINQLILEHCGLGGRWPLTLDQGGDATDEDSFFTLVEVFHDLVARPRLRDWHSYDEHYRYSGFDEAAGQAVYRWRVNEVLADHAVDLELAAAGQDRGLLVHKVADPRQELLTQAQEHVPDGNVDRVDHAVALYRGRQATADDKRRACRELADVLESRRETVLKQSLVQKDEGALFHIANQFAIRHHRTDQMYDYDEAFLDWIFWWYLATVELSNHLISRQDGAG